MKRYTLEIIPGTHIAIFHWVGPISLEDRRKNRQRIVEFCNRHGVRSVIIDGRDQESKTSTMESFDFAVELPNHIPRISWAVVHRPDDESLPFIDTVSANRGATIKAFLNVNAARLWLESFDDSPNKPDAGDA